MALTGHIIGLNISEMDVIRLATNPDSSEE